MLLVRRPSSRGKPILPGCVATIGVFDGLHLGHQSIIGEVTAEARARALPAVVFSFEPTPQEYMAGEAAPARLMRLREKVMMLRELGIDCLFCPPFDAALATMPPERFIAELLAGTLAVRHLVIGDDFRFGYRRAGSVTTLHEAGPRHGFSVSQSGSVTVAGERASSTVIRAALADGDLGRARLLLGRDYRMTGRVVGGERLGRQLGFPTANLRLHRRQSPLAGIFAVRVAGLGQGLLPGVASLGTRPTVAGGEPLLEVHLFDFNRDIYGHWLHVDFIARLRDEARFDSLEALRGQMLDDAAAARLLLGAD
ncbi:MAG: bifunctional riboflavin kinase/FAD synthetase [Chromatiales bacterium]|nr:bifunctional riboflavin kinase/FAD synthetase [Chromatiales bacterium]